MVRRGDMAVLVSSFVLPELRSFNATGFVAEKCNIIYINKIPRLSVCVLLREKLFTTECRIVKFCMQVHVNTARTFS